MNEALYRQLKKAEVKLQLKGKTKCWFIPFSKRQIKYDRGIYASIKKNT